MEFDIIPMQKTHKSEVLSMMREFYSSNAVFTSGSEEIFLNDYNNCINNNPCLEGFVFCSCNEVLGYAIVARSFSTEFGKACIWFEDLFVKKQYRKKGIIKKFINLIVDKNPGAIFRLEAEKVNKNALIAYQKLGFFELPYVGMVKL